MATGRLGSKTIFTTQSIRGESDYEMSLSIGTIRGWVRDHGPTGFVRRIHHVIGLRDADGVRYRNDVGQPVLESQAMSPDLFSFRALAVGLFGEENMEEALSRPGLLNARPYERLEGNVLEADGGAIVPSQFANISAYNETVAGLLEAKILEAYKRPEFMADRMMMTIPSNKRQEKFIGISTPADVAQIRNPGASHPAMDLRERFVTTALTQNYGLKVDVTREAVMFDLTRELLQQSELVGRTLALRKENRMWRMVLGVDNSYTYNGTGYATYVASAGNWTNWYQNPLTDYTALDAVWQAFFGMTDQETGQPIAVDAKDLFVMQGIYATASHILRQTTVELRTPNPATSNGYATVVGAGASPVKFTNDWELVGKPSPYAFSAATASDGLAMSASNAKGIWLAGNFKKAFGYVENMPLTTLRANPDSYTMADKGLVFSLFGDEMGVPCVLEPRYVIKCQPQATGS